MAALAPLSGASHAGRIRIPLPGNSAPPSRGRAAGRAPARRATFAAFPPRTAASATTRSATARSGSRTARSPSSRRPGTPRGTTRPARLRHRSRTAATPPSRSPGDPPGDPEDPATAVGDPAAAADPDRELPPQPIPQTPGAERAHAFGEQQQPLPGPFANAESGNPNQGPDPIQQQQAAQEAAAQQAQAQQAAAQAARDQQLDDRAAERLVPALRRVRRGRSGRGAISWRRSRCKINGELQNQPFAGVGTTPPQPFATPEIPNVFLNIPA